MSTAAPQDPDKLVGSKWTAVAVEERRKHWEVVGYDADSGEATLRAVIDGETESLPWRRLRDRTAWTPGWE